MDNKAFYNLSYGVFVLGSRDGADRTGATAGTGTGGLINACITNTCFQAAANPVRIAISSISQNYTCDLIKESGVFSLSVLDSSCTFDLIKHFGYQSGRTVDKFKDLKYELDSNGCPYITSHVCAVLECKVVSAQDLGSHTLFVAEVCDARVMSDKAPLAYADYQARVKPKKQDSAGPAKKIVGWRCKICGYEYRGAELPADFTCPICGHSAEDFEPIYAD